MVSKSWSFAEPRFCTGLNPIKSDYFLHSDFARFTSSEIQNLAHLRTFEIFGCFEQPEEGILFPYSHVYQESTKFYHKSHFQSFQNRDYYSGVATRTVACSIEIQASNSNSSIYFRVFVNNWRRLNKLSFQNILLEGAITSNFS